MVNHSRRQGIEFKITYSVRTNEHGTLLLIKTVDNALQCILIAIYIITVQLHCKTSATRVIDGQIPTAANAQIVARRHNVHHPFIGKSIYYRRRAVGRVVVNHQYIETESGILPQHR